jgi:hypothetical protein
VSDDGDEFPEPASIVGDIRARIGGLEEQHERDQRRIRELEAVVYHLHGNMRRQALLLEHEREKARSVSREADAEAWRKLSREEHRSGILPGELEVAADEAVQAWLRKERDTISAWWPSWSEMRDIESAHRGNPLADVIRRIVGLEGAPLSQILDTLRFKYFVCGPWRSRALDKLSQARVALGCQTEDDVPDAARKLAAERAANAEFDAALPWLVEHASESWSLMCGELELFDVDDPASIKAAGVRLRKRSTGGTDGTR